MELVRDKYLRNWAANFYWNLIFYISWGNKQQNPCLENTSFILVRQITLYGDIITSKVQEVIGDWDSYITSLYEIFSIWRVILFLI